MGGDTNIDTLVLVCDACRHSEPVAPWFSGHDRIHGWPTHCDQPMRLANTTTRDGKPIEREESSC